MEVDVELEPKLIVVEIDDTLLTRVKECEDYIPYSSRPTSCTETTFRSLELFTKETFEKYALEQSVEATRKLRYQGQIREEFGRSSGGIETRFLAFDYRYITENIPINTATMVFCSRAPILTLSSTMGIISTENDGHTFLIAKDKHDNVMIIDPSYPEHLIRTLDNADHYMSQFTNCYALVTDLPKDGTKIFQITKTPHGGKKTRTKSKRTKSKRTKSKRTKSKRTKSKRTKSKRTRTKSKHN